MAHLITPVPTKTYESKDTLDTEIEEVLEQKKNFIQGQKNKRVK